MEEQPLHVRRIRIVGNQRTHPSVIENALNDTYAAGTVKELSHSLNQGVRTLNSLGVFEKVDIECDAVPGFPSLTDVVVTLKETRTTQIKLNSFVQDGEMGFEGTGILRNPLGTGERMELTGSLGQSSSNSFKASLSKPVFVQDWYLETDLHASVKNNQWSSSHDEIIRGFHLSFRKHNNAHDFSYNLDWRDITPQRDMNNMFSYVASDAIMDMAKPSLKSGFSYRFRSDLINLFTELAGFGGDVHFLKTDLFYKNQYHNVKNDIIFSWSARTSILFPTLSSSSSSLINDRFFLGGPLTLRGFHYKGAGPMAKRNRPSSHGDSLGGDLRFLLGSSISAPLYKDLVRIHAFTVAGLLTDWASSGTFQTLEDIRMSAGIGLIIPTPLGRMEINYSIPILSQKQDVVRRFQIGVGMEFM